jgi:hypothetical protein
MAAKNSVPNWTLIRRLRERGVDAGHQVGHGRPGAEHPLALRLERARDLRGGRRVEVDQPDRAVAPAEVARYWSMTRPPCMTSSPPATVNPAAARACSAACHAGSNRSRSRAGAAVTTAGAAGGGGGAAAGATPNKRGYASRRAAQSAAW